MSEKDQFVIDDIGDLSQHFGYSEKNFVGKNIDAIKIGEDAAGIIKEFFHKILTWRK